MVVFLTALFAGSFQLLCGIAFFQFCVSSLEFVFVSVLFVLVLYVFGCCVFRLSCVSLLYCVYRS